MASGEELAERWMAHRKVTEELLGRIPDDRSDFRPWPGAMTCAELGTHIAVAHHMFVTLATGREFERPDPQSLPKDLPGVRALVRRHTEEDAATLRGLDAQALGRPMTLRGREQAAAGFLIEAREHEIHHKGELFEYARISGVEDVPRWVMR